MTMLEHGHDRIDGDEIDAATVALGVFVERAAARTAKEIGFGYLFRPDAPNTYPALQRAFAHSQATGDPLPIASENSDHVIYRSRIINGCLRFWHDANHVRRQLDFGLVDELELSLWHLSELEKAGYPRGSPVWQLLHADLTGQVYVQAFAHRFPLDQRRFATGCLGAGFDHGLLDELRHGGPA